MGPLEGPHCGIPNGSAEYYEVKQSNSVGKYGRFSRSLHVLSLIHSMIHKNHLTFVLNLSFWYLIIAIIRAITIN